MTWVLNWCCCFTIHFCPLDNKVELDFKIWCFYKDSHFQHFILYLSLVRLKLFKNLANVLELGLSLGLGGHVIVLSTDPPPVVWQLVPWRWKKALKCAYTDSVVYRTPATRDFKIPTRLWMRSYEELSVAHQITLFLK